MKNNIKEFIGTDAMSAVEADAETAAQLLAKCLGWEIQSSGEGIYTHITIWRNGVGFHINFLMTSLDNISEAEKAVIEKVGSGHYGRHLWRNISDKPLDNVWWNDVEKIATASAKQRIAAMLSALAELD